jgi:hypothetical protein
LKLKDSEISRTKHEISQKIDQKTHEHTKEISKLEEESKFQIDTIKSTSKTANKLKKKLKDKVTEIDELKIRIKMEEKMRKRYYNELVDTKGKIRVFCRIRPLSQKEVRNGEFQAIEAIDQFTVKLHDDKELVVDYDSVYSPSSNQGEVFDDVKELIQSAIDGYKVCIFAYGATGSGKTHTILGTEDTPGLCPQSLKEMFKQIDDKKFDDNYDIDIKCNMVELYKKDLIDLLYSKSQNKEESKKITNPNKLRVREDKNGYTFISDCTYQSIEDEEAALKTFKEGIRTRKTAKTDYNEYSSRSHLIFTVYIEIYNKQTGIETHGKITFVDLAGSEDLKNQTNLDRRDEGIKVNESLTALRTVIQKLIEKGDKKHIPYNNHILTKLLKDSLGGSAKTLVIVNINASNLAVKESKNSLLWATRLKEVDNKPSMKEIHETKRLKEENDQLKLKMRAFEGK